MRGKVSVENSRVLVEDPPEGGQPATITPTPGVKLFVNEEESEKATPVRSADKILLKPQVDSTSGTLGISITLDRMQAWVEAKPEVRVNRTVMDHPPADDIVLETESVTSATLPWTVQQVVTHIREEQGVTFGVMEDNIADFLERGLEGNFLAAQGTPPSLPVDEKLVVLFTAEGKGTPAVRRDGTVDFRDLRMFPSVSKETILATKHQAIPGKEGTTVTGETVSAPEPKRCILQPGPNTSVSPDGLVVKASLSGRPAVQKVGDTYRFEILPVLEHYSDVNLETGNINFKGDIKITGSVVEGMTVQADGQVQITGSVSGAVIQGEQGVVINSHVFSSKIRAGGKGAHLTKYRTVLAQLISEYEPALAACSRLLQSAAEAEQQVTAGRVFLLLLDHRFKTIPIQVKQLHEMMTHTRKAKLWLPQSLEKPINTLAQQILGIEVVSIQTIEPMVTVLQELHAATTELDQLSQQQSYVELASVDSSLVETTGNVKIGTQGSYNSTINAGGNVKIDGTFRGGLIQAKGNVWVATAGNRRSTAKTKIQITHGKKVKLGLAYPEVVIQIDNRSSTVEKPIRNVTAELQPKTDKVEIFGAPIQG